MSTLQLKNHSNHSNPSIDMTDRFWGFNPELDFPETGVSFVLRAELVPAFFLTRFPRNPETPHV